MKLSSCIDSKFAGLLILSNLACAASFGQTGQFHFNPDYQGTRRTTTVAPAETSTTTRSRGVTYETLDRAAPVSPAPEAAQGYSSQPGRFTLGAGAALGNAMGFGAGTTLGFNAPHVNLNLSASLPLVNLGSESDSRSGLLSPGYTASFVARMHPFTEAEPGTVRAGGSILAHADAQPSGTQHAATVIAGGAHLPLSSSSQINFSPLGFGTLSDGTGTTLAGPASMLSAQVGNTLMSVEAAAALILSGNATGTGTQASFVGSLHAELNMHPLGVYANATAITDATTARVVTEAQVGVNFRFGAPDRQPATAPTPAPAPDAAAAQ